MKWRLRRIRKRRSSVTVHYVAHKETARALVHEKLLFWNSFCQFSYKRVAIRNTKGNWGSCTSLKNLNFNYKILFLPSHLQDYIVVHELCHLAELNHGAQFWNLVALYIPEYKECIRQLKIIEKNGMEHTVAQNDAVLFEVCKKVGEAVV